MNLFDSLKKHLSSPEKIVISDITELLHPHYAPVQDFDADALAKELPPNQAYLLGLFACEIALGMLANEMDDGIAKRVDVLMQKLRGEFAGDISYIVDECETYARSVIRPSLIAGYDGNGYVDISKDPLSILERVGHAILALVGLYKNPMESFFEENLVKESFVKEWEERPHPDDFFCVEECMNPGDEGYYELLAEEIESELIEDIDGIEDYYCYDLTNIIFYASRAYGAGFDDALRNRFLCRLAWNGACSDVILKTGEKS